GVAFGEHGGLLEAVVHLDGEGVATRGTVDDDAQHALGRGGPQVTRPEVDPPAAGHGSAGSGGRAALDELDPGRRPGRPRADRGAEAGGKPRGRHALRPRTAASIAGSSPTVRWTGSRIPTARRWGPCPSG